MRDEQKTGLFRQIPADERAARLVQMIRWLVDEQIPALPREQQRQQKLCLFAARKRGKRAVQCVLCDRERSQFPPETPFRHIREAALQQLQRRKRCVRNRIREILEPAGGRDRALMGILPLQKPQERCFAASVAARQTEPPIGVKLEADVLKYIVKAAGICKGQVCNLDQCHRYALPVTAGDWISGYLIIKNWLREPLPQPKGILRLP